MERCKSIAERLLRAVDAEIWRDAEFNVDARRAAQVPISKSMWTLQGQSVRDLGPGFREMEPSEFLTIGGYMIRGSGDLGREAVRLSRAQFDAWRLASSDDVVRLRKFFAGFTDEENLNFIETVEQRRQTLLPNGLLNKTGSQDIKPINVRVERAVLEFKNWTREIADEANQRNLLIGFHVNYLPHMRQTRWLDDPKYAEKAIDALAYQRAVFRTADEMKISPYQVPKEKVVKRPQDFVYARDEYNYHVVPQLARIAPQLEQLRTLDLPGYELDPMTIIRRYSQVARQRFAEYDVWGERDSLHGLPVYASQLFEKMKERMPEARDEKRIDAFIANQFGYAPFSPQNWFARTLGDVQGLKMTLSVFSNTTQAINNILRTNFKTFIQGGWKLLNDAEIANGVGAREFALRAGLIADNVLRDAALYQGGGFGEKALEYTGYIGIEKLLRMNAAINGAVYLQDQFKKADGAFAGFLRDRGKLRLRELGFDYDTLKRKNGPQFEDMLVAARRVVDQTQHVANPVDMPFSAKLQNPENRWLLEFNTFNYKNTLMFAREIRRQPTRVAIVSLAAMPIAGQLALYGQDLVTQGVIGAPEQKYRKDLTPAQRYIDAMAAAGSWGLAGSFLKNALVTTDRHAYRQTWGIVPPRMNTAVDLYTAGTHVANLRGAELSKLIARQFGGIGAAFARKADE